MALSLTLPVTSRAQHTRFSDGIALGDLAQSGLQAETVCDRTDDDLEEMPGDEPLRRSVPLAGEVYASRMRGSDHMVNLSGVGNVRAHLSGACWDLTASFVASTRAARGALAEGKLLLPQGRAGAVALFATARYGDDSLAARELHLDREIAAGLSYTTFNLYPATVGLIARLFGDTVTRLDLRARLSGSGVAPIGSKLRPGAESPDVLRRLSALTMLHLLHKKASIVYEAEETDRFIGGRAWRRHSIGAAYQLPRPSESWIILRRTVQGLSRDPRDREWALHLSKMVF
jgi:hypothetical protein